MGRTGDGLAGTGAALEGEALPEERGALSKAKFVGAGNGSGRIRPGKAIGGAAGAAAAAVAVAGSAVAGDGVRLTERGAGLRERSSREARRRQ